MAYLRLLRQWTVPVLWLAQSLSVLGDRLLDGDRAGTAGRGCAASRCVGTRRVVPQAARPGMLSPRTARLV